MNKLPDELVKEAEEHIDYWTDTTAGKMIQFCLENGDEKALREAISASKEMMFEMEFRGV